MRTNHRHVVLLATIMIVVSGCSEMGSAEIPYDNPATIETIPGSDLKRVTLTPKAVERIGIETETVSDGPDGMVIPYAAVIYLPDGSTWAYTNPEGHSFVREELTIDEIRGTDAILSAGPAVGTAVATVGVAELLGVENKVGK